MHIAAIVAAILLSAVLADDQFLYPPPAGTDALSFLIWQFGQEQLIAWSVDWDVISLVLWQDYLYPDNTSVTEVILESVAPETPYPYDANTSISLYPNNIFFLRLHNGSSTGTEYIESDLFEIVDSSASAPSSTVTQTATAPATLVTVTDQATTQPTKSPVTIIGGLTSTDKVGLSVGLGIGLPLLASLAAIAVLLVRRGRDTSRVPQGQAQPLQHVERQHGAGGKPLLMRGDSVRRSELGDTAQVLPMAEMEGRRALY